MKSVVTMENELDGLNFTKNEVKMTMQQIAEAAGVSKDIVRNCVRRIFPDKMKQGKTAYFNETEVAGISKELKANDYVNSHLTSEESSQVKSSVTSMELQQNFYQAAQAYAKYLEEEKARLEAENKVQRQQLVEQKPKVEWYDSVADSDNLVEIGTAGKVTGIGANKIFSVLVKDEVIYKKFDDGISYYASSCGYDMYFRSIPVPFQVGDKIKTRYKLMLTQKGMIWITKRYQKKQSTTPT